MYTLVTKGEVEIIVSLLMEAGNVINNHLHVTVGCFLVVAMIHPCFLQ